MPKTKNGKITASVMSFVEKYAQKPQEIKYDIDGVNTIVVMVKPVVPFQVIAQAVRLIKTIVFLNDGDKFDDYAPENLEFAKRYAVITYFTNFALPADVNDAWLVLYNTPLYDDVMKIVGEYANDLFKAAEKLIDAKLDNIAKKSPLDGLAATLEEKIKGMNMEFSPEDMQSVIETFKKLPNLSTEEIVGAVVKAQEDKDNNNNNQ